MHRIRSGIKKEKNEERDEEDKQEEKSVTGFSFVLINGMPICIGLVSYFPDTLSYAYLTRQVDNLF